VWTGIAGGADTILFWCWRDEVFGRESAGFGLTGNDGFAQARLDAMRKTGRILREHADLLSRYRPDPAQVGILFSPQSYYLTWAQEGTGKLAQQAVQGYARALIRANIPYTIVEEEHLDALQGLKVLFCPRTLVADEAVADALSEFIRSGGVLVAESECGAYGSDGLYRYPEDRCLARLTGVREVGRRTLASSSLALTLDGQTFELPAVQWLTPLHAGRGSVLASNADGPLAVELPAGEGCVLLCGTYLGDAYYAGSALKDPAYAPHCTNFEAFVSLVARRSGVQRHTEVLQPLLGEEGVVHVKTGRSGDRRVVFVFFDECASVRLRFPMGTFRSHVYDLITGELVSETPTAKGGEYDLVCPEWGMMVLVQDL
jgi:beta-galactosidase